MGKKPTKSETLDDSDTKTPETETVESTESKPTESEPVEKEPPKEFPGTEKPKQPYGPSIHFKNLDLQNGGIANVKCPNGTTPVSRIQMIVIESCGVKYTYQRI